MSKLADNVYDVIRKSFPTHTIHKEHYINYKGTRLFFDYFIKSMGVLVEVQGRQHTQFVKHFHGNRASFLGQKKRDNLKLEYVQSQDNLCLVRFYDNEKITEKLVLDKLYTALDEGFCE